MRMLSTIPLMNAPESSVPNFLPISMASLMETFGGAWEVVHRQALDPDKTLASEKRPASEYSKRSVTLPTVSALPLGRDGSEASQAAG